MGNLSRAAETTESRLNETQQRRLLNNAKYADQLLSDVEAILNASESKSIFPKYAPDVSLAQVKLVRNYIARFRDQLARAMDGLGIVQAGAAFSSVHCIRVNWLCSRHSAGAEKTRPAWRRRSGRRRRRSGSRVKPMERRA
jgi:hypothetical protein